MAGSPALPSQPSHRVACALERARAEAARPVRRAPRSRPRGRVVAMGDPQASALTVLSVLDAAGLLGPDGRLAEGTHLVSMGDHFDWGEPGDREAACRDGHDLLRWLASHSPDQVTLLLGNHDLARVGELVHFDDARYRRARAAADRVYRRGAPPPPDAEAAFVARHPEVPTSECLARDFSSFSVAQRDLVTDLLVARRFRAGLACGSRVLLTHAGLTLDELTGLGLSPESNAEQLADRLDARLDEAVGRWDRRSPLSIDGLHQPGSGPAGEARGFFSHRPSCPDHEPAALFRGPLRRRFDARRIPPGLTQVVGHTSDAKCRSTLAPWVEGPAAAPGELRCLVAHGDAVRYRPGLPASPHAAARLVFVDGGMARCPTDRYRLLDLRQVIDSTDAAGGGATVAS